MARNNTNNQARFSGGLDLTSMGFEITLSDGSKGLFIPQSNPCIYLGTDKTTGKTKYVLDIVTGESKLEDQDFYVKTVVGKVNKQKFNLQGEALNNFQKIIGNLKQMPPLPTVGHAPQQQIAPQTGFGAPAYGMQPQQGFQPQQQGFGQQMQQPAYPQQQMMAPQQAYAQVPQQRGYNPNYGGQKPDMPAEICQ